MRAVPTGQQAACKPPLAGELLAVFGDCNQGKAESSPAAGQEGFRRKYPRRCPPSGSRFRRRRVGIARAVPWWRRAGAETTRAGRRFRARRPTGRATRRRYNGASTASGSGCARRALAAEVLTPLLLEVCSVLIHQLPQFAKLAVPEPARTREHHRREPELGIPLRVLDVNMRWLPRVG